MKKRVVVGMSGGVDSSVAAALLKQKGYEVIGLTMCFSAAGGFASSENLPDSKTKKPSCCGLQGIEDARRVAQKIGIKHYVLNFGNVLRKKVIDNFINEYLEGRTPNPCVRCNQYLKFDLLLKKAFSLGAEFLATGHYARISKTQDTRHKTQEFCLKKAKDRHKDQSYFLYRINQEQLKHMLFPLGDYTKDKVRAMARKFGLLIADKPGSQEICFLPDADYRSFLRENAPGKIVPGPILDLGGKIVGEHKGIAFYTIGQREGLGIAFGYPVYVVKISLKDNTITVGKKEDVYSKEFLVSDLHFIGKAISPIRDKTPEAAERPAAGGAISNGMKKKIALNVKIRYNHKETRAEVLPFKDKLKVIFKTPQFAVTPGQSAVFYNRGHVIGGGIIDG